jgi:hypothetical protein
MKSASDDHFDVCGFLYAENARIISIRYRGETCDVSEKDIRSVDADLDFWIVPERGIRKLLGDRYTAVYPMFLGKLVKAISIYHTPMPIIGVRFKDVERAGENGGDDLQRLANAIAIGGYLFPK